MRRLQLLRLPLLLGCLFAVRLAAAPWSTITTDLPPDPSVRWGVLPNGVRYAVMPNHEPKGRVSLRLLVAAGSLVERDDERGLAHFLEHMAFRGTKAYPRGALVPALEHAGIALGPDNTAFTTPDHTIYHLELPDAREAMLRLGLGVFTEYASGITFDADLIERERGVVLSEMATRNTPDARASEANHNFLWPEARVRERAPIGTEEAIRHFTREQFVGFYDAWYRPERLAVIVVGDVVPDDCIRLITELFSPLAARAPARDEPANLATAQSAAVNIGVFTDPRWAGLSFSFEHPFAQDVTNYSRAWRADYLHRVLAFGMLQRRLEEKTHRVAGNFVAPTVTLASLEPGWLVSTISVAGTAQNWQPLAAEIEQEHRRAVQFGFTREELRQVKVQIAAGYENAVRTADTRGSPELAGALCNTLLYGGTLSTPAELQKEAIPVLEATTPDDCLRAFRAAWGSDGGGAPHVFVAVNAQTPIPRTDILKVLNESRNVAVRAPEEKAEISFAYTDFGPAGHLRREDHLADLDVWLGEFDNGVKFNFKSTTFAADTVELCLRVGDGRVGEPMPGAGLSLFANAAVMNGGLHRHSVDDLNALMAGHNLSVTFTVGEDAHLFTARCARRELLLCLQVIGAYLTDAAFEPAMIRQVRASLASIYVSIANSAGGAIRANAETVMTNDARFRLPKMDDLLARDYGDISGWLGKQFHDGAIELTVVGDVPWEEARDAVARTVGALPARTGAARTKAAPVRFTVQRNTVAFANSPALNQSTISFYWPVPDAMDVFQERRCVVAAMVLGERVRERLREDLGATYTPEAEFIRHEAFPGFSYFLVTADVSPGHAKQAAEIISQEVVALLTKGVGTDTFARVHEPYLRARADDIRTNEYWLYTALADAQTNPARLTAVRNRAADGAAITRDEITAILRRYLRTDALFLFTSYPGNEGAVSVVATPDKLPKPVRQDRPEYPESLREKKIAGVVTVEFEVGVDGRVTQAKAVKSPDPELSKLAEAAVRKWLFTPAEHDGRKVATKIQVGITFDPATAKK